MFSCNSSIEDEEKCSKSLENLVIIPLNHSYPPYCREPDDADLTKSNQPTDNTKLREHSRH